MTTIEKHYEEFYNHLVNLILKCMVTEDKASRNIICKRLLNELKESKEASKEVTKCFDNLVEKLTNAAEIIQKQNEWETCLEVAMEDKKEEIIRKAFKVHHTMKQYELAKKDIIKRLKEK